MGKKPTHGICSLCGARKTKSAMRGHLHNCAVVHDAPKGDKSPLLQMRVHGRYDPVFWIDLEAKRDAKLRALDDFLRRLWLECCGHLSAFHIDGVTYSVVVDTEFGFRRDERSMNCRIREVLHGPGHRFGYEYDFGSTTELVFHVCGQRDGVLGRSPVRLLARNEAPVWPCKVCGVPATLVCVYCRDEGNPFYCADHTSADDPEHEEAFLPVVNSPRMGVCGYTGEV